MGMGRNAPDSYGSVGRPNPNRKDKTHVGTRASIIRKNLDESFDSIYTHWDGYPSHHGPILLGHYNTSDAVAKLLALGALSSLGEEIGEKHNFDKATEQHPTWCLAYGRDRGEDSTAADHYADADALKKANDDSWTEWIYMSDEATQAWYFTNNPSPTWFKCCPKDQMTLRPLTAWEEVAAQ